MRFQALDKLINLYDGYRRLFRIDQLELLLIERQGERFLVEARCPHRGQSLAEAGLEEGRIRCPRHGYEFSLVDGSTLITTEAPCRSLRVYDLIYQGNEIGLLLPE
ncbi:MAG: Rieske (2Fe-2S) protein [Pseudomonadota bacterium]